MNKEQQRNLSETLLDIDTYNSKYKFSDEDTDPSKYKFSDDDFDVTHDNATISNYSEPTQQTIEDHETIQENPTLFSIACEVLKDGLTGSATYFIMMGYIFFQGLFIGHTQKPILYLASLSASQSWLLGPCNLIFGFNSGICTLIGRCMGMKDYKGMRIYLRMNMVCICVFNVIFWCYTMTLYFSVGYLYDDYDLIYYTRLSLTCCFLVLVLANIFDALRNFYLGCECFVPALIIEAIALAYSVTAGYISTYYFHWEIYGAWGVLITTFTLVLILYIGVFWYAKGFEFYWNEIRKISDKETTKPITRDYSERISHHEILKSSDEESESNSILAEIEKKNKVEKQVNQYGDTKLYRNFIKDNAIFGFIMFFECLWWELDSVVVTLIFSEVQMSAQYTLINFASVIDCIGFGFGMAISAKLGRFMVKKNTVNMAKMASAISVGLLFSLGLLLGALLYIFNEQISHGLVNNDQTRYYLMKNMKIFAFAAPFLLLNGAIYSILRSVGRQNAYFCVQVLGSYIIHFGSIWI